MILGILEAGEPPEELSEDFGRYPAMFRALLGGAAPALAFRDYDVRRGELPAAPEECGAYLITGSGSSVFEDEPWIRRLEDFIRAAARERRKLVGICFGHQAVAQALGGAVERSPRGWGLGRRTFPVDVRRPWMTPPLAECSLYFSHQDQVTALPPGAEVLAGDSHCPIQMYGVSDRIFCVQGHPEFSRSYAEAHLRLRGDRLPPERLARAREDIGKPVDAPAVARWIAEFLRGA